MIKGERPHATDYDFGIPPTDDERERLMDPEYWDWDAPVEVVMEGHPGLRLTLHLDHDDVEAIGAAARRANMPIDQYVRWAALIIANATAQLPDLVR